MRRLFIALLLTLLLPTLCSCAVQSGAAYAFDSADGSQDPEIEMDIDSRQILEYESNSRDWLSIDESGVKTFSEDHDGIMLTVTTDKIEYAPEEPIRIRTSLKNNTDREIYIIYYMDRNRYPLEFNTELSLNNKFLTDGTYFDSRNARIEVDTVAPGEELTDYKTYQTYYPNYPDSDILAESGEYSGSCSIRLGSKPDYPYGDEMYSIDFSVTLI